MDLKPSMMNWLPYDLAVEAGEICCKWIYLGDKRFTEPFFEETIRKCRTHPYNSGRFKVVTSLGSLEAASKWIECSEPAAFIFHTSRCGSTLLTQLLSLEDSIIVVPEFGLIDKVLRLRFSEKNISTLLLKKYLTNVVRFAGQKRFPCQNRLIIKLDSWHLFMLDEIKQWYPETPLIFMYRQPDEIVASHRRRPGMHAVPGLLEPEIFGFSGNEVTNPDQYLRQVMTKMFHKIITGYEKNKKHLLLSYNAGVRENFKTVADFLEISLTSEDQEAAENRLQYHSKYPHERFENKDCQVPDSGMEELEDLYRSLETIRLNQPTEK